MLALKTLGPCQHYIDKRNALKTWEVLLLYRQSKKIKCFRETVNIVPVKSEVGLAFVIA